jgi:CrcB protein
MFVAALTLWSAIAVAAGAIPGALSRYYLTLFWTQRLGNAFPYGTFLINISGAFTIGIFSTLLPPAIGLPVHELLVVGFLGAYTTFSTYALDTATQIQRRKFAIALLYWIGSPLIGLLAEECGSWVGWMLGGSS